MSFHNLGSNLEKMHSEFKNLKFGKDRPAGGSSNEPYIKNKIPTGDPSSQTTSDFLLRGGSLTPKRIANDISRLSKLFFDSKSPRGLLFTAKQNLLSRISVATQASGRLLNEGAYLPTSTLANLATSPFGYHLNKQGLNPFKGTGHQSGGKGLFRLIGLNDPLGLPTYDTTIKNNQPTEENRLVSLYYSKITKRDKLSSRFRSNLISPRDNEILSYPGGPGSILGIGRTIIKRTVNSNKFNTADFRNSFYFLSPQQLSSFAPANISQEGEAHITSREILLKQQQSGIKKNITTITSLFHDPLNRIETRVNLGDPGRHKNIDGVRDLSSYTKGLGALDKINFQPLYRSQSVKKGGVNDLIQFRIGVIDSDDPSKKTYIHFRAYLDSFSDNYNAEWSPQQLMGRGETLFKYNSFDRKINLGWTVVAHSKEELIPMYQKLNYLASSLSPNYSKSGYIRGNLISLTVGGYLHEQIGILNSITYTIPEEATWEIGINDEGGVDNTVKELPHLIRVTGFSFTPIHQFIPEIHKFKNTGEQDNLSHYISLKGTKGVSSYDNMEVKDESSSVKTST